MSIPFSSPDVKHVKKISHLVIHWLSEHNSATVATVLQILAKELFNEVLCEPFKFLEFCLAFFHVFLKWNKNKLE